MAGYSNSDVVRVFVDDLLASTEDLEKITITINASAQDIDSPDGVEVLRKGLVLIKDGMSGTYVPFADNGAEETAVVLEHEVRMEGEDRLASAFFQATFHQEALVFTEAAYAGDFNWQRVQRLRRR